MTRSIWDYFKRSSRIGDVSHRQTYAKKPNRKARRRSRKKGYKKFDPTPIVTPPKRLECQEDTQQNLS